MDESKLTDDDTKAMMIALARRRGMISQYDAEFVNPPKLVKHTIRPERKDDVDLASDYLDFTETED